MIGKKQARFSRPWKTASAVLLVAASASAAPLQFVPNRGQDDAAVLFRAQGGSLGLFVTATEVVAVVQGAATASVRRVQLAGANPGAGAAGEEPQAGVVNYLVGGDANRWQTGLPTFGRVRLDDVYPGITASIRVEKDEAVVGFSVQPGADPSRIALRLEPMRDPGPAKAWQESGEERTPVEGRWLDSGHGLFRLKVGVFDPAKALFVE